jgi:hypothetical protein
MTMRLAGFGLVFAGLAACAPELPNSGPGFSDYNTYQGDLTGAPLGTPPAAGFDPARVGAAIDAAEQGTTLPPAPVPLAGAPVPPGGAYGALVGGSEAVVADRPRGNAPAGIAVESGEMARNNAGISDEQDFNAVSQRETIESDAERIARNKAQYQVIQPTALPERSGDTGPSIVEYALNTRNAVGEQIYSRSAIRLTSPEAACARYRSPDLAQEAFLGSGGPQRDPKGLDPDGDGFACAWDPGPFRTALQ